MTKGALAGLGLEHVTTAGSGSAPLPPELMRWYHRLGLALSEGYAVTEDFAYSHIGMPDEMSTGTVGRPFPDVQARIADDGEVLVKSPGQTAGYYKQPELNAESFTDDGFFRTGEMLVVAQQPWSMEAGTLTQTMKIKRSRIEAEVAHAVDGWYANGAPVVWA